MLIAGTFLVRRHPEGWRVGVQLGARRGLFLDRCHGRWSTWGYGPGDFAPYASIDRDPPDDLPGGVREPRRPSPSAGGSEVALEP